MRTFSHLTSQCAIPALCNAKSLHAVSRINFCLTSSSSVSSLASKSARVPCSQYSTTRYGREAPSDSKYGRNWKVVNAWRAKAEVQESGLRLSQFHPQPLSRTYAVHANQSFKDWIKLGRPIKQ